MKILVGEIESCQHDQKQNSPAAVGLLEIALATLVHTAECSVLENTGVLLVVFAELLADLCAANLQLLFARVVVAWNVLKLPHPLRPRPPGRGPSPWSGRKRRRTGTWTICSDSWTRAFPPHC